MGGELSIVIPPGPDPRDQQIAELREENRKLARALSDANVRAERAIEDANRALGRLRTQLTPLYRALQGVFGELDAAGVGEGAGPAGDVTASTRPQTSAVWDAWKQRLPPAAGKVIDALLLHGEMSQAQLKVAARIGSSTVGQEVSRLLKLGLINKVNGRVTLKGL